LHGETVILAEARVSAVFGEHAKEAKVVRTMKGKELEGTQYEPLYRFEGIEYPREKGWHVVCDDYVTLTDGTGIVHTAPAFGEDDARIGRNYGLPFIQLVDTAGKFVAGTPWAGVGVKDVDPMIIRDLKDKGLLVAAVPFTHNYPFCWRCDTALLYYARSGWFIAMTRVRDALVKNNRSVNWYPDNIKEGRMGNFVENVVDWALTRERYWGTPLPMWICENGHQHVVGSRRELMEMATAPVVDDLELHRPFIDAVEIACPACGKPMRRVPEVIDCWYDSGSMPFAQWHYPFENEEVFAQRFPADFICEAVDQTRGWFYTMLAISTLLFDKSSFDNCLVLGHVQDENGKKMSKHVGNVVDPWSALDKHGADAVRWYFYTASAPWLPSRYSDKAVNEGRRKFLSTLQNAYAFFVLYANIDNFDPKDHPIENVELTLMDRWILSRLNQLIKQVDEDLTAYRIPEPANAIEAFVDDLSNWYIRRGRERFWGKGMDGTKEAAFATLYAVLTTLAKTIAPFVPFISEDIYQNLVRSVDKSAPESIHLTRFPAADESRIDETLNAQMAVLLNVVSLGRACRNLSSLKVRQPLQAMYVKGAKLTGAFVSLAADELNVKDVVFTDDARAFTTYNLKPQMRTLGPKYGKLLGKIGAWLKEADGNDVVDAFSAGQPVRFELDGTEIVLEKDDVLTKAVQKAGFAAQIDGGLTVVLDCNLTPELIAEGYQREVISKLQTMRKEADFDVTDRILVSYQADAELSTAIESGKSFIMQSVLAKELDTAVHESYTVQEWDINGKTATLGIKKA
ncbi:MAG: class I tRNA ligase family protein, partial [Bacillota bacterium]